MREKYEHLAARLQGLMGIRNELSNISSAGSALPVMHQVGNALSMLTLMLTDDMLRPVLQDLADLENYNGPQAQWEMRKVRTMHGVPEDQVKALIRSMYPAKYDPYLNLEVMLQSLVPNMDTHNELATEYGPNTLDVRPVQPELVKLLHGIKEAKSVSLDFESETTPDLFLDGWTGKVKAEFIVGHSEGNFGGTLSHEVVVKLTYGNESTVMAYFSLHVDPVGTPGKQPLRFYTKSAKLSQAMTLSGVMGNTGLNYQYCDPNNSGYNAPNGIPLPTKFKFWTDVYNEFEGVHYTSGMDMIGRPMVDGLLREFLKVNGVEFDQSADREWLDPKFLYKFLKPIIDGAPYPGVIPLGTETHFEWQFTERIERNYRYNYDDPSEYYKEADIVDKVEDPTEIKSRRILFALRVTENHSRYPKYNILVDIDSVAEDCEVKCYDTGRKREFQPTPWMMKWIFSEMVKERTLFLPLEEQRQIEAAAQKVRYEEQQRVRVEEERIRMTPAKDASGHA